MLHDAKAQVKALIRQGIRLGGLSYDTSLAGWLLRRASRTRPLSDLVERYLGEKLPEADPSQLVPETEGATPSQEAWFALRVADALREDIPEAGRQGPWSDIELPTLLTLADLEVAGVAVSHDVLSTFSGELAARAEALAQEAFSVVGREFNLGSPSNCRRSCSKTCSCRRPERPRPVTRRMPRFSPTCRRATPTRS